MHGEVNVVVDQIRHCRFVIVYKTNQILGYFVYEQPFSFNVVFLMFACSPHSENAVIPTKIYLKCPLNTPLGNLGSCLFIPFE